VLHHRPHHDAEHQRGDRIAVRLHDVAEDAEHRDDEDRDRVVAGDGDRFEESHWQRMEAAMSRAAERNDDEPSPQRLLPVRPPARRVIRSGYMAR
jgi:hypothetical protein